MNEYTVKELRELAKTARIRGYSKMNKATLLRHLFGSGR
jgi:hypothetical protein